VWSTESISTVDVARYRPSEAGGRERQNAQPIEVWKTFPRSKVGKVAEIRDPSQMLRSADINHGSQHRFWRSLFVSMKNPTVMQRQSAYCPAELFLVGGFLSC